MNKEQQDIILDVYREHCLEQSKYLTHGGTIQEFIKKIKTDSEFSEKWGLKIEERELSLEERLELWFQKNQSETGKRGIWKIDYIENYEGHKKLNSYSIPTKLITLTYNNEKIGPHIIIE